MKTMIRHGETHVISNDTFSTTFSVKVKDVEWFGGFLEINPDDQTKMRFLVPIGQWSPIFGKLPRGFGSVICGDARKFKWFLEMITITTQVKEAIVYESVGRKNGKGNWTQNPESIELFRITHDWKGDDKDVRDLCLICDKSDCECTI